MNAYCVSCKRTRPMQNPTRKKGGKRGAYHKGRCPVCNTVMVRFGG